MSEEEKARACKKGESAATAQLRLDGRGIYALTDEERIEIGRKGYQKGLASLTSEERAESARRAGNMSKERGTGVHGMTYEERLLAARKSVQSRGQVPYTPEEENKILVLSDQPRFIHDSGKHTGSVNCILLAKEINEKFHHGENVRNRIAVSKKLRRLKK